MKYLATNCKPTKVPSHWGLEVHRQIPGEYRVSMPLDDYRDIYNKGLNMENLNSIGFYGAPLDKESPVELKPLGDAESADGDYVGPAYFG